VSETNNAAALRALCITVLHSIYRGLQRISQIKAEEFLSDSPVKNAMQRGLRSLKVTKKTK
jgi:hypothetical protein